MTPLLKINQLKKYYPIYKGVFKRKTGDVQALREVDLTLYPQETVAIVGESGCGKSTLAQCVIRLIEPTSGSVTFLGREIAHEPKEALLPLRREIQMVFQDPFSSLNPRKRIKDILVEPLLYHKVCQTEEEALKLAKETLAEVGLNEGALNRFPHQFSGGQQQRIAIGRAIILKPKLIILDEAVSSLDVSVQAQILNLLASLQERYRLSYLFITHDLQVVEQFADRVFVLYLGKVMESGPTKELFSKPRHPYTEALLSAAPKEYPTEKRERILLKGDLPSPIDPPPGCPFHTRCPYAQEICKEPPPHKSDGPQDWFCILDLTKKKDISNL